MELSARVLSHEYSAEGETARQEKKTSVAGLLLALCIPVFAVMIGWAAVESPEVFLQSLMWGVYSL